MNRSGGEGGGKLLQLFHQPSCGALLSSEVPVVGKRHSRRLPPQRIHNPGQILTAREQVLIEPDPRRVRADAFEQPGQIVGREIGQPAEMERTLDDRPEDRTNRSRMQRYATDVVFKGRAAERNRKVS